MILSAARTGAKRAAEHFGVREASVLETLLGVVGAGLGGSVARGAINAASPRLMSSLENIGAAPVNMVRRALGPTSPADAFVKHLNAAHLAPPKAPIR